MHNHCCLLTMMHLWVYNIISASLLPWMDNLIICARARWSGLPRPFLPFTRFTSLSVYHDVLLRVGSEFSLPGLHFYAMAQHWVSLSDADYVKSALVLTAGLAELWKQNLVGFFGGDCFYCNYSHGITYWGRKNLKTGEDIDYLKIWHHMKLCIIKLQLSGLCQGLEFIVLAR